MTRDLVIAVDGGNSKTDLAVVAGDGSRLGFVRGPLSSPHHLGLDQTLDLLDRLLAEATVEAGLEQRRPAARIASIQLAGLDFPREELAFRQGLTRRRWAERLLIGNDTLALLRAGSEAGWGVAVVCGAGINCIGVAPDGREARFRALGAITGDWGGGYDLGIAAVSAAARSEDGRGPRTTLEREVPAHFGLATPSELAEALHLGRISLGRVVELAPVVLTAAEDDAVTAALVDRLAREVVIFARTALEKLDLLDEQVDVVLGGGVLASGNSRLLSGVESGLREVAPHAVPRITATRPIVGAALLGLDALGADAEAKARARRELVDIDKREPQEVPHV